MNFENEEITILFNKFADEKEEENLKSFYDQIKRSIDFSLNNKSFHFDSNFLNGHENINLHLKTISNSLKTKSFYLTKAVTLEDWREKNKQILNVPVISFLFRLLKRIAGYLGRTRITL